MKSEHFWGMTATFFGTWEAISFVTHGKIPTVSRCVWKSFGYKTKPLTKMIIAIYLLGLGHHLLNGEN